ncbi:MAG: patatin-like phospholipase family protein [Anaerolineaceae bacterium]|nr:patatin-like phospholipase family protein [Anaerolineaceae bacterium]
MEISLALGGGGIKGIAHIGVLDCLVKEGFKIQAIAGTSVGGLIGAVFAAGYQPEEIMDLFAGMNQSRLYSRNPKDGPSLLGYTGVAEALIKLLGESVFSDLKIPFACTAVDLLTCHEVYLNEGLVVDALLATIAVPGIFPPKIRGEAELIDGAVLDPVPVNLSRCLAPSRPVVAVALNPEREKWHQPPQFNMTPPVSLPIPPPIIEGIARMRIAQALRIFLQSMDISARSLTELRLEADHPEVIIRPEVYEYGLLDVVNPKELVKVGYQAAENAIPAIKRSLSWPNTVVRFIRQPKRFSKNSSRQLPDPGSISGAC